MEYEIQLSEIKRLLLIQFKIKIITPGDCETISNQINKHIKKHISVTTLKRLFGLAACKYHFSTFTLFALSEFLNIEYTKEEKNTPEARQLLNIWSAVRSNAFKISKHSLDINESSSRIPYQNTVSREFAQEDFEHFFESDYIFTSLSSQAGFGKTLLLSHLVQDLFHAKDALYHTSTLLLTDANDFFNEDEADFDVEYRLKQLLGIEKVGSVIDYMDTQHKVNGGKFILIFDNFNAALLKRWSDEQLFASIRNFIFSLRDCKNIKIVMSMRTDIWINFYQRIHHSNYLKSSWFPGKQYRMEDHSNIPPLTNEEVENILSHIDPYYYKNINSRLKKQLQSPNLLENYASIRKLHSEFNSYSDTISFEITSRFIQKNIYQSSSHNEKMILLRKIAPFAKFGVESSFILRKELTADSPYLNHAYQELLTEGILTEKIQLFQESTQETICFKHQYVFECFIFIELIEKFNLQVDMLFFNYILENYKTREIVLQLIQWSLRFLIKTGNFGNLKLIFNLNLDGITTNKIMLFLAEEIEFRSQHDTLIMSLLDDIEFHELIISKIGQCDFTDFYFNYAMRGLLKISLESKHQSIYKLVLFNFRSPSLREQKHEMVLMGEEQWNKPFIYNIN